MILQSAIKALRSSVFRITFGFMGVTGFLSMWLANIPTTAMMIPIAAAVLKALDDHRMLLRDVRLNKRRTKNLTARSSPGIC